VALAPPHTTQVPAPAPQSTPAEPDPAALEGGLGLTYEDRVLVQRVLTALGHQPGQPDGRFGPNTRRAIAAWQRERGDRASGYLTDGQLGKLREEAETQVAVGLYGQPGDTFRDCEACPEMVVVPAGAFMMGSTEAERKWAEGHAKAEEPLHKVNVAQPFALGKYEVTRKQFASFVNATGYSSAQEHCPSGEMAPEADWKNPGIPQDDRHPVVCVNWHDAVAYTSWLTQQTGHRYRLPSEAEWEYAARANTKTARYWGDDETNVAACAFANVADLTAKKKKPDLNVFACEDGWIYTSPVGSFRPNPFGFFEMLGNVSEWVEDCWTFSESYHGAPTDGRPWIETCKRTPRRTGSELVMRVRDRREGRFWCVSAC
jgi:formylglycine-generating enzyme required for sulfatase activity